LGTSGWRCVFFSSFLERVPHCVSWWFPGPLKTFCLAFKQKTSFLSPQALFLTSCLLWWATYPYHAPGFIPRRSSFVFFPPPGSTLFANFLIRGVSSSGPTPTLLSGRSTMLLSCYARPLTLNHVVATSQIVRVIVSLGALRDWNRFWLPLFSSCSIHEKFRGTCFFFALARHSLTFHLYDPRGGI